MARRSDGGTALGHRWRGARVVLATFAFADDFGDGSTRGLRGLRGLRRGWCRSGGTTGKAAASTGVTSGTVTDIIGNTVYVTNSSGNLVKVTVSSTTTVDRNAASSVAGLRPGDTVTVQGSTATNGTVSAASISATAKGVTVTGGGGFGGFGGGGAGAAAGG